MKRDSLIVFFVPEKKLVNGGIMSIFSQCKETRRFSEIHNSEVVISVYPGYESYGKNDLFENSELVYSFKQIMKKWRDPKKILFHVPETGVRIINKAFQEDRYKKYLKKTDTIHINVMNQNIELMRRPAELAELFQVTDNVTQTTAHIKYTTQELSDLYQTPVHHLSVFIDPSQYKKMSYEEKENLILYSPDENPAKNEILQSISSVKDYSIKEVRDIPYEEYKKLSTRAKFCITFREGFDGYFIESFFSGGIGIAVYNDKFFPSKDFMEFPSVFDSYKSMSAGILDLINTLDSENNFNKWTSKGQSKIADIYSFQTYLKKIESFYKKNYDFTPRPGTASKLIKDLLEFKKENIDTQIESRLELKRLLHQQERDNTKLEAELTLLLNSKSWKITKPLRKMGNFFKS